MSQTDWIVCGGLALLAWATIAWASRALKDAATPRRDNTHRIR